MARRRALPKRPPPIAWRKGVAYVRGTEIPVVRFLRWFHDGITMKALDERWLRPGWPKTEDVLRWAFRRGRRLARA